MSVRFGNWQSFLDTSVKVLDCPSREKAFMRCQHLQDCVQYIKKCRPIRNQEWIVEYFKRCKETPVSQKSSELTKKLRVEGNLCFKNNKNNKALDYYNQSVLHAPAANVNPGESEEPDKALALANRSAALYHLNKYEMCLADINMALASEYPIRLRYKLLQRKGQCFLACEKYDQAKKALEEAVRYLDDANLSPAKKESTNICLRDLLKKASNQGPQQERDPRVADVSLPIPVKGYGPVLVQASSSINLKINQTKGRHLKASSDISAGDVLIVEKPYAAVLLPSHYATHCHHCFGKLVVLIPCHQCTQVRYCSEMCRQLSWTSYHYLECPFMDLFHSIGIAHLSVRIIVTTGLQNLMDFYEKYLERDVSGKGSGSLLTGLTKEQVYERSNLSVFALMTHSGDMEQGDLFQYGMTACLLLECLVEGNFFDSLTSSLTTQEGLVEASTSNGASCQTAAVTEIISQLTNSQIKPASRVPKALDSWEKVQLYVGGLLLRHICQLVSNAHAITELQVSQATDCSLVETISQVRIATAIYPTTSLMNHSCDPTIISRLNDVLVVRAVKDVKSGEEIFNCYGPHHKRMPYGERQQSLKEQYFFDCVCHACKSQGKYEEVIKALRCPKCSGPLGSPDLKMTCLDCGEPCIATNHLEVILTSHDELYEGLELMNKGDNKGALVKLKKCLKLREEAMYKHNKDLAEAQDAVAKCLTVLGEYSKAADLLRKSVQTTEVIYGETSIEVGNELQKYAEVLFHTGNLSLSKCVAERAINILKLNYGASNEAVTDLDHLISIIAQQNTQ